MATRENQGLFIAVILLVLLSVVLAVATFFGFSGMREAADQRDSYKAQFEAEQKQNRGFQAQAGIFKAFMGVGDVSIEEVPTLKSDLIASGNQDLIDETNRIESDYNSDMAKSSSGEDGTEQSYRKLIDGMVIAIHDLHVSVTVLTNSLKETEQKMETEINAKNKQLAEKDNQLAQARQDLTDEQGRHEQTRIELGQRLDDTEMQFKESQLSLQETQTALSRETARLNNEIDAKKATIIEKEAQITSLTAIETDVADGQIRSVAPVLGKVVINLGSDDNLRLKQTFAVYDQAARRFKSGEGKATVEVTRILGAHLAEARITSQDIVNPILTNDFVVTSTWDPGYSVPIAIAGRIDMDGDGTSDLQRLISIVEQKGYGKVVAYHDEDGAVTGQIDENTRFFVRGEDPLGKETAGYNRLDLQRERYQTRVISVQEFLHEMGLRNEAKVRRFDENLPSTGFEERKPGTQIESGNPFGGN